jgi:hypothetical protein
MQFITHGLLPMDEAVLYKRGTREEPQEYLSNMPNGWHFSNSSLTSLSCNVPVTIRTTLSIMCPYLWKTLSHYEQAPCTRV